MSYMLMKDAMCVVIICVFSAVQEVRLVCVDVASNTEATVGGVMNLTCIYCMKQEEISAETKVDWFYTGSLFCCILLYLKMKDAEMYWKGRLTWIGSKDLQDISISIVNVSANDFGTYECEVSRFFEFDSFKHSTTKKITIELKVKMQGKMLVTKLFWFLFTSIISMQWKSVGTRTVWLPTLFKINNFLCSKKVSHTNLIEFLFTI
uniref:Sodium channel regulatory subunit beta-3 n=1 Tax=Sinocyclocheilus rhinocerous TaxID=307959 RepID=A0A673HH67_9TELE